MTGLDGLIANVQGLAERLRLLDIPANAEDAESTATILNSTGER